MNIKQNVRIKIQQMNINDRLFVLVYSNQDANSKKFKT